MVKELASGGGTTAYGPQLEDYVVIQENASAKAREFESRLVYDNMPCYLGRQRFFEFLEI